MQIEKKSLATKAAIMYYEQNMMQNEIASEMNVSRSYVSQLLNFARETNIVHIRVDVDEFGLRMIRKEIEFKAHWPKLRQVYIMKSGSEGFTSSNIGKFAAPYVAEAISQAKTIGINPGRSVERTINCLPEQMIAPDKKRKVVQIMGGFNSSAYDPFSEPNGIAIKLGKALGCEAYYVNCPAVLNQVNLRDTLIKEQSIADVLSMWNNIDAAIMGLGSVQFSSFFRLFSQEDQKIIREAGVIGIINTNFFNRNGDWVPLFENQKIGIRPDQFKSIRNKTIICSGRGKALPLLGALRGEHIDTLICDSDVIDELEQINQ